MHTDGPELRPGFGACVYLESYSWGEGKEQQSSNTATESLFLVLFAVGLLRTPFFSSPPRIKLSSVQKIKKSKPRGEQTYQYKRNQMSPEPSFFCICAKSQWHKVMCIYSKRETNLVHIRLFFIPTGGCLRVVSWEKRSDIVALDKSAAGALFPCRRVCACVCVCVCVWVCGWYYRH